MIEVRELNYAYLKSKTQAVKGLSFDVEQGEIFGFLGPSGAGKSTTQKILIGLLDGYQGRVKVRDRDVVSWRADDYERIGVSFETPNHYLKLSGMENLRYFASLYQGGTRDPDALLKAVGLEEDADRHVGQYSKGMKCRLSIARCLLNDPDLMFFDEPTGGLDPVNAQRIKELIKTEREAGKTVFLTTHDMSAADDLCDRIGFIVDGKIACIDSPRSLKLEHGRRSVRVEYKLEDRIAHEDFDLDGLGDNEAFGTLLRQGEVETLHSREATLADVFIKVTGRELA